MYFITEQLEKQWKLFKNKNNLLSCGSNDTTEHIHLKFQRESSFTFSPEVKNFVFKYVYT